MGRGGRRLPLKTIRLVPLQPTQFDGQVSPLARGIDAGRAADLFGKMEKS